MISILIPVKNAAAFLAPCIFSILQQSETDWEAIFVDDHSTDASLKIIQAIAKRFPKIKILKSKGTGIIPALQTAYSNSTGAFITRMDADDIMPIDKLKLLKNKLTAVGPGHVSTGFVHYFSDNTLRYGYIKYQNWLNELALNNNHYQDIYKECVVPSAGFMLYREDLDAIGAFDSALYPEDYDLVFRFYINGLKVVSVNQTIHQWRDHESRTSRNDPKYSGHYFDLKLHYFLKADWQSTKQLVLIGAGKKGKSFAQKLHEKKISFSWQTNNPKKIGKKIYEQTLIKEDISSLHPLLNQIIITIASPEEVAQLQLELDNSPLVKGTNYFWFC